MKWLNFRKKSSNDNVDIVVEDLSDAELQSEYVDSVKDYESHVDASWKLTVYEIEDTGFVSYTRDFLHQVFVEFEKRNIHVDSNKARGAKNRMVVLDRGA